MKRTIGMAMLAIAGLLAPTAALADGGTSVEDRLVIEDGTRSSDIPATKLDVLGVWSHPDDDAGIIAPCGVWGQEADIDCGIMLTTRGEGGSNSVGPEAGPDLGLRRENEDRASHVRAGTVDMYYLDRVDFFYNTSAPLTAQAWDEDDVLRRATRVIRETQPEILVSWTASINAGHGNHQYASRLAFDAAEAAADPTMFPEQLVGADAASVWQVKKVAQQQWRAPAGTGQTNTQHCLANFSPADPNGYTVHGTWTGYESPYAWVEGNTAGVPAGTKKTWAQVGREDGQLHATQARTMVKNTVDPSCVTYLVPKSWVPMQELGTEAAGNDLAVHYGSSIQDPGGLPLGTLYAVDTPDYFVAPGESAKVTLSMSAGVEATPAGTVSIDVPAGWSVDGTRDIPALSAGEGSTVEFTVTAAQDAAPGAVRLPVRFASGSVTAYNEAHLRVTAPIDGRFVRWGNFSEYEEWVAKSGDWADGLAPAVNQIGAGETVTLDVEVANRTSAPASGQVEFTAPDGFVLSEQTVPFDLPAGDTTTVTVRLTHTDPAAADGTVETVTATTTSGSSVAREDLSLYVVPSVLIPELESAPAIDGVGDEYATSIDISQRWEGPECTDDVDCGADSSTRLGWYEDALYLWIDVVDDKASGAVPPERCFGHWLVDSVEVQLDPRGSSLDTSSTFKLGIFPFTDDAANEAGNGVDGPCWTRDADHHQGFSSGPLADTIVGGPNAEGVEVAVAVERGADNSYVGGRYQIEVKIPFDVLPSAAGATSPAPTGDPDSNAIDPTYVGMNVSPYDTDRQDFVGETRLAWSPFGSQQSEPYRWGHAYLDGYEPPADRPVEPGAPIIPETALQGAQSPQTIHQSATHGDTIGGLQPNSDVVIEPQFSGNSLVINADNADDGTVRAFLWQGNPRYVPVWTSSCADSEYGNDACSPQDGQARPWAPDMNGRVLASAEAVNASAPLVIDLADVTIGADEVYLLVSYAGENDVEAWSFAVSTKPDEPVTPVSGNLFFVSNRWDATVADQVVAFGRQGDEVLVGDWNGDGHDTLGVRRGSTFYFDNAIASGPADISFAYGKATDEVLVGDWNGDGADTIAVRRGSTYFVNNSLTGGNAELAFNFGRKNDEAYAGDFDGDGADSFVVRRGTDFFIMNSLVGGSADRVISYGRRGDEVFVGDYDGDGHDTIAIRRGNRFHVKNSLAGGPADIVIGYGRAADSAFVGDWNADGIDTPVVNRYIRG